MRAEPSKIEGKLEIELELELDFDAEIKCSHEFELEAGVELETKRELWLEMILELELELGFERALELQADPSPRRASSQVDAARWLSNSVNLNDPMLWGRLGGSARSAWCSAIGALQREQLFPGRTTTTSSPSAGIGTLC